MNNAVFKIIPITAERDNTAARHEMGPSSNATEGSRNMALTIADDLIVLSEAITKYQSDVH